MNMFTFIATTNPADITDPKHTLGIEVTIPAVVAACGLGNVDPQHGHGSGPFVGNVATSAIAAVGTVVDAVLPTSGVLVTTRPDLDSVGAMALIVLRSLGLWLDGRGLVRPTLWRRVMSIAAADAFAPPGEWSPSPLPTLANPWPRAGAVDSTEGLAHLGMICSPRRGDVMLPLAERVAVIACWLLMGEDALPMNQTDENGPIVSAIYEACGVEPWVAMDAYPLARIMAARERVLVSRRALAAEAHRSGALASWSRLMHDDPAVPADIAVVKVAHAGAIGLGYCIAPVVAAFDQANPRKVTIAAYAPKYLDMAVLKAKLNEAEHAWLQRAETLTCEEDSGYYEVACAAMAAFEAGNKWGGGATIVGSPQNGGTKLDEDTILGVVRTCLLIP